MIRIKEHSDQITGFDINESKTMLLSSSIDGYLGVYDLWKEAKERLYAMSDNFEEDLTGVLIMK